MGEPSAVRTKLRRDWRGLMASTAHRALQAVHEADLLEREMERRRGQTLPAKGRKARLARRKEAVSSPPGGGRGGGEADGEGEARSGEAVPLSASLRSAPLPPPGGEERGTAA